jgi:DNA-dependent RNA polymerase auxiliary subunit epsilon
MFSREFPFYRTTALLYYNWQKDFRVRGFIREQQYNIDIPVKKFTVDIPASAKRLDSL